MKAKITLYGSRNCSDCPVSADTPWQSFPGSPVLYMQYCDGSPVLAVLSWQSCPVHVFIKHVLSLTD